MALACIISSSTLFEPVFQSFEPNHWCATPELDDYNCSDTNLPETQCREYKKSFAIPSSVTPANETVFSRCTKYTIDDSTFIEDSNESPSYQSYDDVEIIGCDAGWVYETSEYPLTLVTDVSMAL